MKEYTFMFMNVDQKHVIYGKWDEGQRGTRKTLPKMANTMNIKGIFFGDSTKCLFKPFLQNFAFCEQLTESKTVFVKFTKYSSLALK